MTKTASTDEDWFAACERLTIACYSLMDHGRYDETAALFTSDATWVRGGHPVAGRDAILASMTRRSTAEVSRHVVTNVMVTRTGNATAEASALFVAWRGTQDASGTIAIAPPVSIGDLALRFRRDDGIWYIVELKPQAVFRG